MAYVKAVLPFQSANLIFSFSHWALSRAIDKAERERSRSGKAPEKAPSAKQSQMTRGAALSPKCMWPRASPVASYDPGF